MQALLERGRWSRKMTSARVFWPCDNRSVCVLCRGGSTACSELSLVPFGQTGFQRHRVLREKPFQSGLFWQNILMDWRSLGLFLWGFDFSNDPRPRIRRAGAWLLPGAWVAVCIAPLLTAATLPWPQSGFTLGCRNKSAFVASWGEDTAWLLQRWDGGITVQIQSLLMIWRSSRICTTSIYLPCTHLGRWHLPSGGLGAQT